MKRFQKLYNVLVYTTLVEHARINEHKTLAYLLKSKHEEANTYKKQVLASSCSKRIGLFAVYQYCIPQECRASNCNFIIIFSKTRIIHIHLCYTDMSFLTVLIPEEA